MKKYKLFTLVLGFCISIGVTSCKDEEIIIPAPLEIIGKEGTLSHALTTLRAQSNHQMLFAAQAGITFDSQSKRIPENSISAINNVAQLGIDIVEIDVRTTQDGVLVLMKDETIDRTTTGSGRLKDLTYSQLQQYYLETKAGDVSSQKVPTLEEALTEGAGRVWFKIDLTNDAIDFSAVNRLVKQAGVESDVLYDVAGDINKAKIIYELNPAALVQLQANNSNEVANFISLPETRSSVLTIKLATGSNLYMDVNRANCIAATNITGDIDNKVLNNANYADINNLRNKEAHILETEIADLLISYYAADRFSVNKN
ncbi:glycerophosphodiester phosphodiesterase family protein [Pseudoxanthomonas sp. SGD-10]|nr:glycerophosphodiester phosphodiesterase family protein [Pseudoxanthomonas sp. SGD-10]